MTIEDLKCPNCNTDLSKEHIIALTGIENDEIVAFECPNCKKAFVNPEDFSDSMTHNCKLDHTTVKSKRGDEYKVKYCGSCAYYSIVN
jgi:hypothetical protein